MDSGGLSSDEVLYSIANNKLRIMNSLLKLIKEASVDCSLNAIETMDPSEPFTCVNYGPNSRLTRDDYSYTPNIMDSLRDRERARRYETKFSEYKFAKIKGKEYAIKKSTADKLLIYDNSSVKAGRPGKAIGEIDTSGDSKKVKFY